MQKEKFTSQSGYPMQGAWLVIRYRKIVSERGAFNSKNFMGLNNESNLTYSVGDNVFETITKRGARVKKTFISLFCGGCCRIENLSNKKLIMQYDLIYHYSEN